METHNYVKMGIIAKVDNARQTAVTNQVTTNLYRTKNTLGSQTELTRKTAVQGQGHERLTRPRGQEVKDKGHYSGSLTSCIYNLDPLRQTQITRSRIESNAIHLQTELLINMQAITNVKFYTNSYSTNNNNMLEPGVKFSRV